MIQYNRRQHKTIHYKYAIQNNKIQYNTIHYNTIQYDTIQYNKKIKTSKMKKKFWLEWIKISKQNKKYR